MKDTFASNIASIAMGAGISVLILIMAGVEFDHAAASAFMAFCLCCSLRLVVNYAIRK